MDLGRRHGRGLGKFLCLARKGATLYIDDEAIVSCPPGLPYVPRASSLSERKPRRVEAEAGSHTVRVELSSRDENQDASVLLAYPNFHLAPWDDFRTPAPGQTVAGITVTRAGLFSSIFSCHVVFVPRKLTPHSARAELKQRCEFYESRENFALCRLAHDFPRRPALHCENGGSMTTRCSIFVAGRGTFHLGSSAMPIEPGALFIVRPDVAHSFTTSDSAPASYAQYPFRPNRTRRLGKTNYGRPFGSRNPRRGLEVLTDIPVAPGFLPPRMRSIQIAVYERLFQATLRLFRPGDIASRVGLKAAFLQLLAFLFRQARAQAVSLACSGISSTRACRGFHGRGRCTAPLELAEIARTAGLSRSYFATCLHDYYGLSPAKYHLRQQIEKAATVLAFGGSVKETAASFGFPNGASFQPLLSASDGVAARDLPARPGCWRRRRGHNCEDEWTKETEEGVQRHSPDDQR